MKSMKHEDKAGADLSALLSRTIAAPADGQTASGIDAVELTAEQLERISGGMMAIKAARAGTTCSPCADDCGC